MYGSDIEDDITGFSRFYIMFKLSVFFQSCHVISYAQPDGHFYYVTGCLAKQASDDFYEYI